MPARRGDIRALLWSAALATWCVLWPAAIVAATWSMPGFMSLRGRGGLAEVVEMLVPLPFWATALAAAVLAFALIRALLLLCRRCDPDGDAVAAARWSLSSPSLNALVLLALAAVPVAAMGSIEGVAAWLGGVHPALARFFLREWWLLLLAIGLLPALLWPFCLFNAHTLARERLERWWRPLWPGAFAVVVGFAIGIGAPLLHIAFANGAFAGPGRGASPLPILALGVALNAAQLAALSFWLSRSTWRTAGAALARAFHLGVLRRWVALELLWLLAMVAIAVPALSLTVFDIYFAPQFVEWERSGTVAIPPALRALLAVADSGMLHEQFLHAVSYALGLYALVSAGRLLVGLGIGAPAAAGPGRATGE
jgi:hypothetical protein